MKRGNKRKLTMIGVLMLVSQVALALFVGKWLNAQYAEEKGTLAKQLEGMLSHEYDRAIDSVIGQSIKMPIYDSIRHNRGGDIRRMKVVKRPQRTTIAALADTLIPPMRDLPISFTYTGDDSGIMARGIRTFVVKFSEELPTLMVIDSIKLRKRFEAAIKRNMTGMAVDWNLNSPQKDAIILESTGTINAVTTKNAASITRYAPFVLKKIAPQIGFSALLLLLCGMAFILSYNTARKQMKLSAQKDGFISNMSHELKTPVATAKVAIEALRKYHGIHDPVKTKDYLQMAAWEIDRLEALIANVLNNVQLEDGRMDMQQQPLDLVEMVRDIVGGMQPLFNEKDKQVSCTVAQASSMVRGDRIHLQGVVYNVLDNAIKYGGSNIDILLKNEGAQVIISISDDGPGIPEEYKRKIFEKFFRIPSGNVHNVKGYGLGLNYTRFVVKAHNGSIHQENNEKGGATFIISLPSLSA